MTFVASRIGVWHGSRVWAANLPAKAQVLVIGGGYGGATAAKYVRTLSHYKINVVLI